MDDMAAYLKGVATGLNRRHKDDLCRCGCKGLWHTGVDNLGQCARCPNKSNPVQCVGFSRKGS